MSIYSGRHGANVSQYLRDLNTINPQDTTADDGFNIEDDLALFTNTQFYDFDSGQNLDFQAQPVKPDVEGIAQSNPSVDAVPAPSAVGDLPGLDFMPGDFNFSDFGSAYAPTPLSSFADNAQNLPGLELGNGSTPPSQQQTQFLQADPRPAAKRKAEAMAGAGREATFEEPTRVGAEEDKRRRNTAASARFRIKKKQREQALEKSAKEMTEKITGLESRVSQLETENKWLKNLLVEKNEGNDDITALWKDFTKHASETKRAAAAKALEATADKADN